MYDGEKGKNENFPSEKSWNWALFRRTSAKSKPGWQVGKERGLPLQFSSSNASSLDEVGSSLRKVLFSSSHIQFCILLHL